MRELAEEEIEDLEERIAALTLEVRELLVPQDPLEDRPAVVEVRAGTGGRRGGALRRGPLADVPAAGGAEGVGLRAHQPL